MRLIVAAFSPHREHDHGEFSGDGNHGFFLSCFAAPGCELEPVGAQVALGAEGAEDVLCGLDQQAAQVDVASLADRQECGLFIGYYLSRHFGKGGRGWGGQEDTEGLEGAAQGVDQGHAGPHQAITQFNGEQMALRLFGNMRHWMEQVSIEAGDLGEHGGVTFVALPFVLINSAQLAGIGDKDFLTFFREETADPRAVRSRFDGHQGSGVIEGKARKIL